MAAREAPTAGRTAVPLLPIEDILDGEPLEPNPDAIIGRSRDGRPIHGYKLGTGASRVSLIGGCHADEPVGPEMLSRLGGHLARALTGPLLGRYTFQIIPHVNPDGRERNRVWSDHTNPTATHDGRTDRAYDYDAYQRHRFREKPGDDIEFGFPRGEDDDDARPENSAVASFLAAGGPYVLHITFHSMGLATGPWFLLDPFWIGRTAGLRATLAERVATMGYDLFDIDRMGEKGFFRIAPGFTTRPDSRAMRDHFLGLGDPATASRFRPSSMEYVCSLGGDPLTMVSEMPLFLCDRDRRYLAPMPLRDQMRLQLELLAAGLATTRG